MIRFRSLPVFCDIASADQIDALMVEGASGESVSAGFAIESMTDLDDVTITPPDGIDLYVAMVREQPGTGLERGERVRVAELLVKDDRECVRDGFGWWCGHLRHVPRRLLRPRRLFYAAPDLRLSGGVTTSLRKGDAKQIHVVATVPDGGIRGVIDVRNRSGSTIASLNVRVSAVPVLLTEPPQERFLWYRGTLDCTNSQHYVSDRVFAEQLATIRRAGFTSVSLNERRIELLNRAIRMVRQAGFERDVVLHPPYPAELDRADFCGLGPVLYVGDEPDVDPLRRIPPLSRNLEIARALGVRTMSSVIDSRFAAVPPMSGIDVVDTWLPRNAPGPSFRYYWQSHLERPNVHRLLAGALLWSSGAPGIAPYCFQHRPVVPSSPFDDDALWEPAHASMRPHMTTYPARSGTIPTLQWLALAEGINDLRWLTTVEALRARAAGAGVRASGAASEAAVTLEGVRAMSLASAADAISGSEQGPPAASLHEMRARLMGAAAALVDALR